MFDWDVIVVGGGAAGLWAAGTAAHRGRRTLVLEKNRKAGVKILISGGTRCNLTHQADGRSIADAFGDDQRKFLYSPLARLTPAEVIATMESLGVPTKVETTGKVFPRSDRALDVRDALVRRLIQAGGTLRTGISVRNVTALCSPPGFEVLLDDGTLRATQVILATGGKSYPGCGTTGDGYSWVESLGHHIISPRPALTPLCTSTSWINALPGVTIPDAIVTAVPVEQTRHDRSRLTSRSSLLFTHVGLSGPGPLNVSRAFSGNHPLARSVQLDLAPEVSGAELTQQLKARAMGGVAVAAALRTWLPRRLAEALLMSAQIAPTCPLAELRRAALTQLIAAVKANVVSIDGTMGYAKAEVTAGGVDLREVDSRTMRSRIVPGLYLVGEILDLDGPIGGYNFQAAFSTGHCAGLSAASDEGAFASS